MKILAIETSGMVASVAVAENEKLLCEFTVNFKKTHSQTLLPMIDEMVRMIELDLGTLDAIAVSAGPGSFTGLRIGSATAKGLALSLGIKIVPVPTLEAMAFQLWGTKRLICPLMDARNQQVFSGVYEFREEKLCTVVPQFADDIDRVLERLNAIGKRVAFSGDTDAFLEIIQRNCRVGYSFAPSTGSQPRAASVAALGMLLYEEGKAVDSAEHRPEYLRLSQAERERSDKEREYRIC